MRRRVAVVGGGMAGCAAARELIYAGREVLLLESTGGLAGRARSWHRPELENQTGLSMWIMTAYRKTLQLVREHGLSGELVDAPVDFVIVHRGRPAVISADSMSRSMSSVLRYPHLSVRERFRLMTTTAGDLLRRGRLDMFDPECLAPYDDGATGADWARLHISQRGLDNFIRAEIESLWLWRCEEASGAHVRATHANLVGGKLSYLRHGMEILAKRMVEGAEVRLGAQATEIAAGQKGMRVTWRRGADGDVFTEDVDEVVVATTADVAAKLTVALPPATVSGECRRHLETQRYEPVMLVTYLVDADAMPPDALIIETGDGPHPIRIIVTQPVRVRLPNGRLQDKLMMCGMPGRAETSALIDRPDDQVFDRVSRILPVLWPTVPAHAEPFHVLREPRAMPWPEPGRFRRSARVLRSQKGPVVFAGDHFCSPTTEAALRSGFRAAEALGTR